MSIQTRNARASVAATIRQAADPGADGPAARRRRYVFVPTERAGVHARQVLDPGPLAGLRLEQRQLDAAAELGRLYREGLPAVDLPMAWPGGGRAGRTLSREEEAAAGVAWHAYCEATDAVLRFCGVRGVTAVESAVVHRRAAHPSHLVGALTALADHWGLLL